MKRERIEVPVARGRIVERDGHKLGVVELLGFSNGAHGLLRREIDEAAATRAPRRSCSTCAATAAACSPEGVLVSSIFIEDGKIVSVRGRHRPERTQDAEGDAIDEDVPVVTLVDGGSAARPRS